MSLNMPKCTDSDSSHACAKAHPGICFALIHSIMVNNSVRGQRGPCSDCANAQAEHGLRWPHKPEESFTHGATHLQFCLRPCFNYNRIVTCKTVFAHVIIEELHALRD